MTAGSRKKPASVDEQEFLDLVSKQGKDGSVLNLTDKEMEGSAVASPPDGNEPDNSPAREESGRSVQTPDHSAPAAGTETKRRRIAVPDFDEILYAGVNLKKICPKTVYISTQTHRELTEITSRLTRNEVSISAYVENIIRQHFNIYRDEINERNRKMNNDILK